MSARAQWWGRGPAPHEVWPGVSIDFKAQWSTLRDRWETHDGRYYYDPLKANRACDFFPVFLQHHIGEFAGQPFELRPDQDQLIVRPTFGWRQTSDGFRRFRKVFAFCPKGYGKALAVDTPIATPDGWTTMGAIRVGDRVFDERGVPCCVVAATDVMVDRACYRVTLDDGETIVADADHLWQTEQRSRGNIRKDADRRMANPGRRDARYIGIRTTREIAETLRNRNGRYQSANHSIATAAALVLPDQDVPIDPYVLGMWLGDGDSDCARITAGRQDVAETVELLAATGTTVGVPKQTNSGHRIRVGGVGVRGPAGSGSVNAKLRALDLLGNKHIPFIYLRASRAQRLALLQGLMDSDGSISATSGQCEYCSTSGRLARDAHELIVSLGYKASSAESAAMLRGREVGRRWRVSFHPDEHVPVFRLARKKARQIWRHSRRRLSSDRRIVKCESVASVPVRCIEVSSESRLYLAGRAMVPTHNSPLGAGLGLYLARYDGEAAAEVYAVAGDREQAKIVHDNAKVMVENSPDLFDGSEILKNSITWDFLYAKYVILSSDASTKHGFRPHGIIFDELHNQKNRDLFEALTKSMAKRLQPLLIIITHAGDDDESICYEEYELAKRVLSGNAMLEGVLPVIFEADKKEDWTSEKVWRRVNPGHGITIQHNQIAEECKEAIAEPRKRNDFLRYRLNRWTSQATAWIPIEWWDACEQTYDDAELSALQCCAGLDLAQKWDLAAFVVVFRRYLLDGIKKDAVEIVAEEETGAIVKKRMELNYEVFVRPFFWIPEETMEQREREDGVAYRIWAEEYPESFMITEGAVIDYSAIYSDITTKIVPRFPLLKQGIVGYDPAFATDIATKLRDVAGMKTAEVLQNYKMLSEPSQIIEALIKGRRVRHDGHAVLRWCWENVSVKTDDAGRIRPVKPRNASKRVDGAVAMVMAEKAMAGWKPEEKQYQMIFVGG